MGLWARVSGVRVPSLTPIDQALCKGHLVRGEYTESQHEHDGITTDAWQGSVDIVGVTMDSQAGRLAHSS